MANLPEEPGQKAGPCVMVIFGATGDLTRRKLIPALFNLASSQLLAREFAIVGCAFNSMSTDQFRESMTEAIKEFATSPFEEGTWKWFLERMYFVSGDFQDPSTHERLRDLLSEVNLKHATQGNYFYYLATAPSFFGEIVRQIGRQGLTSEENGQWRRVIIEKPFGHDLESARKLNHDLKQILSERQIYRIDHYLGKETVQNLLVFRFGNGLFEPIWNRNYVDSVQVTAAEVVGVEQRGKYYDVSGALRDMVPNHLFQLVTLTAMEPPISFEADAVRDEQDKILEAIQPPDPEEVLTTTVRGQYGPGEVKGVAVPGYRAEPYVDPESKTETYVALKLEIENWRWAGVPFYLRTGKRLPDRVTEISIQFRRAPFVLFRGTPVDRLRTNRLVIHIQPDEGISLRFGAKIPGPVMRLGPVEMDFNYSDYFGTMPSTGYERLLYDCMTGDATLFQRADMVEAAWRLIEPVLDVWKALPPRAFPNYAAGSWGPKEAEDLLKRDGREWRHHEE